MQQAGRAMRDVPEGRRLLWPEPFPPVPVAKAQDTNLPAAVNSRQLLDPGDGTAGLGALGGPSDRGRLDGCVRKGEHLAHGGDEVCEGLIRCLRCGYGNADAAHDFVGISASAK